MTQLYSLKQILEMPYIEEQPLIERDSPLYTMEEVDAKITIDRNVCMQHVDKMEPSISPPTRLRINCKPKNVLKSMVPAADWLCSYKWNEWLVKDVIAGITVAVMNIPQGMAYALLGNVPPVVGIYMALFPVLVYALLGTSRHVSMGSFAVICLMTGNVVSKYSTSSSALESGLAHSNSTLLIYGVENIQYSPIQVASAVAFLAGIYQVIMYILRFGVFCTLLSEHLVSGFTAAAAIHVFTSQLKDVFGLKITAYHGPLKLIYIYADIISKMHTTNLAAVVVSAITIVVLIANNEFLKPFVSKKCSFPVPIELIVVLCGTLASTYGHIAATYNLKVVGDIPIGLPTPEVPSFTLFRFIAVDSLIISIIAYVVTLSMALIFANKLKYEVDPNQELLAQGCGNLVGSFFSCMPFSASLSRSAIQQTVGGCTQLASVVSAMILTCVLLWVAPFFELLPRCILASLIIVALKGIIFQASDIIKIWKVSSLDAIVWITTYISVIVIEIDYGLLAGVLVSVIILFIRGIRLNVVELEKLNNTEIFLEADKYSMTEKVPGITILHYTGSLNFVNKSTLRSKTLDAALGKQNPTAKNQVAPDVYQTRGDIILDLRSVSYIDSSGASTLRSIVEELQSSNRRVLFVGISGSSTTMMQTCNVFSACPEPMFPSVQDAVSYALLTKSSSVYCIKL